MLDILLIVMLIFFSAFFSGSETALTAISRARIYRMVMKGHKRAEMVSNLREKKEEFIGSILLGNNLVNIAATAIATSFAIQLFGDEGVFIVTIILTLVILIFAEVLPKTFAIRYSEQVAFAVAPIIAVLVTILSPITRLINWLIRKMVGVFGVDILASDALSESSDVIRGTIELHHREGDMHKHDRDMLGSILDLSDVEVDEVMEHRKHVQTVDASLPAADIITECLTSPHMRLPFWRDDPDNIIGLMYVRDLMRLLAERQAHDITHEELLSLLSEPWFIPETTKLKDQLKAFRDRGKHFAHVVDEYGDFQGVITLEDIIEEIVGNINDEHEEPSDNQLYTKDSSGAYLVVGTVTIRDLNRELDWDLPDDHAVTVAGLVIHESRSIPKTGAIFLLHGYRIRVLEKKRNQILKLQIYPMEA